MNFDRLTKEFLLSEGHNPPDASAYLQSISETLSVMTPRTQKEARRLAVAKENVKALSRQIRRMQEQINVLEEMRSENG